MKRNEKIILLTGSLIAVGLAFFVALAYTNSIYSANNGDVLSSPSSGISRLGWEDGPSGPVFDFSISESDGGIFYFLLRGEDSFLVGSINEENSPAIAKSIIEGNFNNLGLTLVFSKISSGAVDGDWTDNGVKEGSTYHYVLVACDKLLRCNVGYLFNIKPSFVATEGEGTSSFAGGGGSSKSSSGSGGGGGGGGNKPNVNEASINAPLNLEIGEGIIDVTHKSIVLTWEDNSDNEEGFLIERATSSGGSFAEVGGVGENILSFKDGGLEEGKRYWYRIKAYNSDGSSEYSNVVSEQTLMSAAVNLPGVSDFSTALPFADLWKQSREPIAHGDEGEWDSGIPLPKDSYGWVTSIPEGVGSIGYIIVSDTNWQFPSGEYILKYEGNGTFALGAGNGSINCPLSTPGECIVNLTHQVPTGASGFPDFDAINGLSNSIYPNSSVSGMLELRITSIDAEDYPRNISLYMPGQEDETFNLDFLEAVSPFSTIRFMDWQQTNNNELEEWSERTTPHHSSQANYKRGVALEYMIELANALDKDMWVNIPHNASDDFVMNHAEMIRDNLDEDLAVYVEYSNEVWNGIFEQAQYAQEQGISQGLGGDNFTAQLRYYSKRSVEIFDIYMDVFEGEEHRVKRVLAGQAGNPWTGQTIMDYNNANESADYYATAPYFGGNQGSASEGNLWHTQLQSNFPTENNLTTLFTYLDSHIESVMATNAENAGNASIRGLAHIAYEGGQHLVGINGAENNQNMTVLFVWAQRDERMKDAYGKYIDLWCEQGGGLMAFFDLTGIPGKWGSWGAKESLYYSSPENSYKYEAIREFISSEASECYGGAN